MLRRPKRDKGNADPDKSPYLGLRNVALTAVANGLPQPPPEHPEVSGAVVDVPAGGDGSFVTIVGLTDDTTSMYTSVGGGTLGAGTRPNVAAATHALLTVVQAHLAAFPDQDDPDLPPPGQVRFHILTPTNARTLDVPEDSFWGRTPHDLMPVIAATQALIGTLRETPGA